MNSSLLLQGFSQQVPMLQVRAAAHSLMNVPLAKVETVKNGVFARASRNLSLFLSAHPTSDIFNNFLAHLCGRWNPMPGFKEMRRVVCVTWYVTKHQCLFIIANLFRGIYMCFALLRIHCRPFSALFLLFIYFTVFPVFNVCAGGRRLHMFFFTTCLSVLMYIIVCFILWLKLSLGKKCGLLLISDN